MKKRLAALVMGFVLAGFVVGVQAAGAQSDSDVVGTATFHPFTMDSTNTTCVPWANEPSGPTRNCDPVDLVFPGKTWQQVQTTLKQRGWTSLGQGSTQVLHFANASVLVSQSAQLFLRDGFFTRYHVRLWQVPGANPPVVVAAVHHERTLGSDTIDRSWEASEAFIASQLCTPRIGSCSASPVMTQQAAIQAGTPGGTATSWRGWANDARATVISLL
jgi:hypothetical protein